MTRSVEKLLNYSDENLQRIAFQAAAAGFASSLALLLLYFSVERVSASLLLQSALYTACVLLWPSGILLLGAHTAHGGVALFLLSACINSGYFVFMAMLLVTALERIHSRSIWLLRSPAVSASRHSADAVRQDRSRVVNSSWPVV